MTATSVRRAIALVSALLLLAGCRDAANAPDVAATDETAPTTTVAPTSSASLTSSTSAPAVPGSECDPTEAKPSDGTAEGHLAGATITEVTDDWIALIIEPLGPDSLKYLTGTYSEVWCDVAGTPTLLWRSFADNADSASIQLADETPVMVPGDIGFNTNRVLVGRPEVVAAGRYELRFDAVAHPEDESRDNGANIENFVVIWDWHG